MILLHALASLALRFALALPFWNAGLTRWEGFLDLRAATLDYYETLRPTLFGETHAVPNPDAVAWVASFAEILLPAALVIGFATRLSAFGLLLMTLAVHGASLGQWQAVTLPLAAMALALIAYGPGGLSVDHLIRESWRRPRG